MRVVLFKGSLYKLYKLYELAVQSYQQWCTCLFYVTFPFNERGNGTAITKVQTALNIAEFDTKAYFSLHWGNQRAVISNRN